MDVGYKKMRESEMAKVFFPEHQEGWSLLLDKRELWMEQVWG